MVGSTYSLVPEGGMASLIEIQNELAIDRAKQDAFSRLVWIPPDQQVKDPRQQQLIDRLRGDARSSAGTDLLERPLEDLRTAIRAWFSKLQKPQSATARAASAPGPPQLYLIYDKPDADAVAPFADFLFKDFEVINPGFDGDEAELRQDQEENLRNCDGVLIFYGSGNEPGCAANCVKCRKALAMAGPKRRHWLASAWSARRYRRRSVFALTTRWSSPNGTG
jgi:hypothetical protein